MKISTKGRYGLKAVMEIARQADNGHVSMRDLSQTTGISASYLEQLFKKLRAAGVLRSVRGAQGGYALAKSTREITAGEVLRALEGSMAPTVCAQKEYAGCVGREFCIESYLYQRIRDSIDNVIDAITLAEMLEIEKQQSLQRPKHLCGAREGI